MTTEQVEEVKVLAEYKEDKPAHLSSMGIPQYADYDGMYDYNFHTDWNQLHNVWQKFRDENDLTTFKDNIKLLIVYCDTPADAASELAKAITWLQTIKK